MSKVMGFLGFTVMVLFAILIGSFLVRLVVPSGYRSYFSFA